MAQLETLSRAVSVMDTAPEAGQLNGPNLMRHSTTARQMRRAASPTLQLPQVSVAVGGDIERQPSMTVVATANTASPFCTTVAMAAATPSILRELTDCSVLARSACSPAAAPSVTSAPLLRLSAKAFQLSHTLLSRLASSARSQQPPAQVPAGIVVPDTARHVADVRQPSRDVCMLIGSKSAMKSSIWQNQSRNLGGRNSIELSGSRGGASSLLLLAMEVAEGGCMLGLYVAFPTLMPQPLLAAVRESCEQLLRQVGAGEGGGSEVRQPLWG